MPGGTNGSFWPAVSAIAAVLAFVLLVYNAYQEFAPNGFDRRIKELADFPSHTISGQGEIKGIQAARVVTFPHEKELLAIALDIRLTVTIVNGGGDDDTLIGVLRPSEQTDLLRRRRRGDPPSPPYPAEQILGGTVDIAWWSNTEQGDKKLSTLPIPQGQTIIYAVATICGALDFSQSEFYPKSPEGLPAYVGDSDGYSALIMYPRLDFTSRATGTKTVIITVDLPREGELQELMDETDESLVEEICGPLEDEKA